MKKRRSLTGVLPGILLACLGIAVLWVLLSGASLLRGISHRNDTAYTLRTAGEYLTVKVRQSAGAKIGTFGGCDAVLLEETIDGEVYLTRIYCWDGYLRELFSSAEAEMETADGEKLLKMETLTADGSEGLLTVTLASADGTTETVLLRGGE